MASESKADQAETKKLRGNQALSSGAYEDAVTFYSEAIQLDGSNHVYYSNRAVAQLKLGQYDRALADASKCIELNPSYPKGYSNKGTALEKLNRANEAKQVYTEGLRIAPNSAIMKANLERLNRAASGAGAGAGAGAPPAGLDKMKLIQFVARSIVIAYVIGYLLPFWGPAFSFQCYKNTLLALGVHYIVHLVRAHGRPRWSQDYGVALMSDPYMHSLFFCFLFYTARPRVFALIPPLIVELVYWLEFLYVIAATWASGFASSLAATGNSLGQRISANPNFGNLSYAAKWQAVFTVAMDYGAFAELVLGIALIVDLFTPMRNLILLGIYWYAYLSMRYITYGPMRTAFAKLDARILGITSHRLCPGIVRTIYSKIRGWAKSRVSPPPQPAPGQAGGAAASAARRCSIM